ncbi:hypothetical protein NC652_000989 [Populus alba x Populus x berolinensis]|nr:hypothetical protein NC652_000989 [Populus alba x Populus x berolinensis]
MALKLERDLIYSLKVREMSCLWTGFANYEHSKVPSGINYLQKGKFGLQKPCQTQAFTLVKKEFPLLVLVKWEWGKRGKE